MKKNLFMILSAALLLPACTQDETEGNIDDARDEGLLGQITMTCSDLLPEPGTRTSLVVDEATGVVFNWAEGDIVGVMPAYSDDTSESPGNSSETLQSGFIMKQADNTGKTATFDGGGWGLKDTWWYAAYYPFNSSVTETFYGNRLPITYEGQVQTGNASLAHLSKFDYMFAKDQMPVNGTVNFNFLHAGAAFRMKITMPDEVNVTEVCVKGGNKPLYKNALIHLYPGWENGGKWDTEYYTEAGDKSCFVSLKMENTNIGKDETLEAWMMLFPTDFSGQDIDIIITTNKGYYQATVNGAKFEAGYAYSRSATATKITNKGSKPDGIDIGLTEEVDGVTYKLIWADWNIGASSPEEAGIYYGWGDIKGHKTEDNPDGIDKYTKRLTSMVSSLPAMFDAASIIWGDGWRMPTKAEYQLLIDNCTSERTEINGVAGIKYTGNVETDGNKNYIFFPEVNYYDGSGRMSTQYLRGYYWTSSKYDGTNPATFRWSYENSGLSDLKLSWISPEASMPIRAVKLVPKD